MTSVSLTDSECIEHSHDGQQARRCPPLATRPRQRMETLAGLRARACGKWGRSFATRSNRSNRGASKGGRYMLLYCVRSTIDKRLHQQ